MEFTKLNTDEKFELFLNTENLLPINSDQTQSQEVHYYQNGRKHDCSLTRFHFSAYKRTVII